MSEALFVAMAGGRHEARSAGTSPAEHVHDSVVTVMREKGIDLGHRKPQLLTDSLARWADVVVTMGCGDACPVIPGKRYIDWELRDPQGLSQDEVRAIRDDIEQRIAGLIESLDGNRFEKGLSEGQAGR
jgi:arsenate reductase (thioredoxin)